MWTRSTILAATIVFHAGGTFADDDWSVGYWYHDPAGQSPLDIKSAVRPRGTRSLVHLSVRLIVQGKDACVVIPSPLHRFVEQDVVFCRVTATVTGRELKIGKDFFARHIVSDQGQPFFCVELDGVDGDITINTETIVLLPPDQPRPQWERAIASLKFQSEAPTKSNVREFQYHVPPANVRARVDSWAATAFKNRRVAPLQGLTHAVKYVHGAMKYEAVVKFEDPYEGLVDDFKGHCGIYGCGLSAVGQQLKKNMACRCSMPVGAGVGLT